MKKFITITLCMLASSVFADTTPSAAELSKSDVVQNIVKEVERSHHAHCGDIHSGGLFSGITKRITFRTDCEKPGVVYRLKIYTSFKGKTAPVFTVRKFKVKVIKGSDFTEEVVKSSDPFIEAYKRSEVVRSVRHFVEDSFGATCKVGRAHRGSLFWQSNYHYTVACKAASGWIKVKVKSKVSVIGDNMFRFGLTNYKVSF